MKKIFRFALAMTLSVAMIFSSLVFAQAAEVGTPEAFMEAITNKEKVINLTSNLELTSQPTINFFTTINGNGYEIILPSAMKIEGSSGSATITINNLKMKRSTGNDVFALSGSPTLILNGGEYNQTNSSTDSNNGCLNLGATFNGTVYAIGGTVFNAARYIAYCSTDGTTNGGTINFIDCTLNSTASSDSFKLQSGHTINIGNGGENEKVIANLTGDGFYFRGTSSSVINVFDGAVITCKNHFSNANASDTPVINVYGGTITCANRLFMSQQKAIFNVYGGTLKSTSTEDGRIFALRKGSSAVVMGGTFTNGASAPLDPDDSSSLKIAGGSFNFDPRSYLAGNYAATNSNGTYSVALSLGTPVEVGTATDLANAISAKNPYIKITAPIALSSAMVLDYDVYIDGGNNKLTSNQIQSLGNAVVTLKDVNIERDGDVTRFSGNAHITMSGGTYSCTYTGTGNNGALYIADGDFTGRVVVTDDATIKATGYHAFYTGNNTSSSGGMVEFIDCTVTTNKSDKGTLFVRSNIAVNIGGGTEGQTATITNASGKVFYNADNAGSACGIVNIKDGAVISETTGNWGIHVNKRMHLNVTGGTFNVKGSAIVVDTGEAYVSVSGGTFTTTGTINLQKNNGSLTVTGGTFSNADGAAIFTTVKSDRAGSLIVDGANITLATDTLLLNHNGEFYTTIKNLNVEQENTIIKVASTGGDITLDNCQLTAPVVIDSASSANINLTNNTTIRGTDGEPITGSGTVNKDDSSHIIMGELHPLVEAINNASAGGTVTVNEDYTANPAPAITIDKDLTFDGTGTIAFSGAGFQLNGANVTFNGNITVNMAADDDGGNNRLFNVDGGSTLTLNGGTFTGFISHAPGGVNSVNKTIVNEGATLNQKNHYIAEVANGYNEMIINGGKFVGSGSDAMLRVNDLTAIVKIYGGEFTYSGTGDMLLIGNVGTLEVGNLETGVGPTMTTTGQNSSIVSFNTGSGVSNASAKINFNAGTFKHNGYGYNIYFNKTAEAPININGGTWTTQWLATVYVNDGGIKDLRINGGTFENKNTGSEQTVWKRNGTLTITGGHFIGNGTAAIFGTAHDKDTGALTFNDTADDTSAITFLHRGSGALIEHRAQFPLNIVNTDITRTGYGGGVLIEKRTNAEITIKNSNITAESSALILGSDYSGATSATVNVINSTLTSTSSRAIDNKWGVVAGVGDTNYYSNIPNFTMDGDSEIIDSTELRTNGQPKMFRFAGGSGSANTVAVSATTASLTSGTYTLTLNYRETGGAWPYVGVTANGKTTAVPKENFVDGVMTYTFTAEGEVKVGIGRETMHAAGAVYFGNVKLTANGSTTNLLTDTFNNADLTRSPINTLTAGNAAAIIPGWKAENIGSFHGARVMEIPSDDFFTADNPVTAENYVYKFEDGDNMDVLLRFHMTEDTNYEFSYNYMSNDGNLRNKLYQGGMDRPFEMIIEQDEDTYKTIVKYTLGNDGDSTVENEGTTIYIDGPDDAYGTIQYLGNFEMYEIDAAGNRITGRNLLAGYSPMYETEVSYSMVTDSSVSSKLEYAYGVYFRNDTSNASEASIVEVDDNFFKKTTFAERRTGVRRHLIETAEENLNLAYDYSADDKVNVVDLLRIKKYEEGLVGADDKAAQLKAEILNAEDELDIPNNATVYYVSNSGNDSNDGKSASKPFATLTKALDKVSSYSSSTTYILLERGGEWRIPSNDDGNGWVLERNVVLGAYGEGAKPVLNGSVKNYAKESWTRDGNIWKISLDNEASANIPGNVYFYKNENDAEPTMIGTIVKDNIPIGKTWNSSNGEWDEASDIMAKLTKNGDILKDYDSEPADWWSQIFGGGNGSKNDVYVYYDGDLNADFAKIEITESKDLLYAENESNITIDNIEVKHTGAHGINLKKCSNVTISNCVIGYIGGAPSENTALGNGIQFGISGSNCTVKNTYVYQCYDAGISPQSWEDDETNHFTNMVFENNLMEKNFYNFEAWNDNGSMQMTFTDNIFKDAGYGWSWNQRYQNGNINMYAAHFYGGKNAYNSDITIQFTNNIFTNTNANIFCWYWGGKDNAASLPEKFGDGSTHYMTFSGNSYYQKAGASEGGQVNYYGNTTERTYASSQSAFETAVAAFDSNPAKVVYLQQWLTDLAEQSNTEKVYSNIKIAGTDISQYVIVNETSTEYGTLSVNSAIKAVTGSYLAVADSVSANGKAIRLITNTGLAPNTVKVYVNNGSLYIAAHDTLFLNKAISTFELLLDNGKTTFDNGYERTVTLPSYTYSGKSGLRLIGDSDKNPVSYNVDETATINIGAYSSGSNQIVSVPQFKVTIYSEATGTTTTSTYTGTDGVCSFTVTSDKEGFVYWTVVACDSEGNKISDFTEVDSGVHYSGSVGFGVEDIAKSSTKPNEFDTNWAAAASEVASTSATATTMESVSANTGYKAYRVVIPYDKAGGFVTGYLTYPENADAGSLGLMVKFQSNSVAAPDKSYDANAAVFTVCAHSLDLTKTGDTAYMDRFKSEITQNGKYSNFAWDNESFDTSYLVKMVKRDLLASKFMIEHFTENGLWNGTSFTAMGTSMGGFQSIAVAALLDDVTGKNVTTLNVSLPWLCDLGAETSGNNRKDSTWRPTYAYADTVHFATMLGDVDEIIVNAGLGDVICPASGVMAFYNTIDNDNKSITFRQNNTHGGGYDGAYYTIVG